MTKDVKIIGHRGFASQYPENSLVGFTKAAELGVDGIELDLHLTKDGEVVVMHDETIDRMTNGSGAIAEMTLAELDQYRLKNGVAFTTSDERIPTLKDVFAALEPYPHLLVNLEIKTHIFLYKGIEEKVLDIVAAQKIKRPIIYSSFHLPTLVRVKRLDAKAETAWITSQLVPHIADFCATLGLDGIHPRKNIYFANESLFADLNGVRPWTVNSRKDISKLLQAGVAAIITKYPERALRIRQDLG